MNAYLKFAYDLGVQRAREKFADNTSIRQQRQAPTWGLGGPLPSGFKAPPPAPPQRAAMTTQGLPPKSSGTGAAPAPQPTGGTAATRTIATTANTAARPITGTPGALGTDQGTAAGVSPKQHAWQQQANRTSAGDAPATVTAGKDIADVVSRGNKEMGQVLRDTSGSPGVPPALTKGDIPQ